MTGTVALATVEPTTLLVDPAASSVGPTKRNLAHLMASPALVESSLVVLVEAAALAGNLVTGYALGNALPIYSTLLNWRALSLLS